MGILSYGQTFGINTNGNMHTIEFRRGNGKYALYVDGQYREEFKPDNFIVMFLGDLNDYAFELDGVPVVVALRFGKTRVAVDGHFTDNGGLLVPVLQMPKWGWAFVVANLAPPVIFGGKIFDWLTAVCFAYTCTHFLLKNPDLKASANLRVVYCVAATLVSWGFFWFFKTLEPLNGML